MGRAGHHHHRVEKESARACEVAKTRKKLTHFTSMNKKNAMCVWRCGMKRLWSRQPSLILRAQAHTVVRLKTTGTRPRPSQATDWYTPQKNISYTKTENGHLPKDATLLYLEQTSATDVALTHL